MKTAYELAMERLNQAAPTQKLSAAQKKAIAEAEEKCKARIAEREIFLETQVQKAMAAGEFEAVEKLRQQLASERRKFQAELEETKESIRQAR
jgi:hypothetical protein